MLSGGPSDYRDDMPDARRIGLTALGFVAAMLVTVGLVRLDPASEIPGLEQAAPREIPVAVVGEAPDAKILRDALNGPSDHPLAARLAASLEIADRRLRDREVSGVVVMGPDGHHTLRVAGAGGVAEAEKVTEEVTRILASSAQRVTVEDVVPVRDGDPRGVGPFRLGAAWTILGLAFAGLLGLVFGDRSAGPRLVVVRFAGLAIGALVAGVGGAVISDVLLDRLAAPFWPLALVGAAAVFGTGAVGIGLIAWFGRLGFGLAALGLAVGVPGAIGAWPLTPLPTVWPTLLAWLPPGVTTWAVRGIAYFDGSGLGRVLFVLGLWSLVGVVAATTAARTGPIRPGHRGLHPVLARHRLVGSLLAVATFGLLVVVPAVPAFTTTDLEPALQVRCRAFDTPTSVEQLNRQVERIDDFAGVVGGDVGASTRLRDGRLLFVFGDTVHRPGYGAPMVRNSMLLFAPGCAGAYERRDRGAVIPDRADGVGYWPMSAAAVRVRGHDLLGVTAQRVANDRRDDLGFRNLGPALAVFSVEEGRPPVLQRVVDLGPDDPDRSRPTWGAATAVVDDVVYVYGTSRTEPGFGWSVSVARVRLVDIADQSAWRYWDGRDWQADPERAAVLIDQHEGVSQTFSVFRHGESWYAVSKRDDFVGTDLVVWKAPAPTGPFTAHPPAARIPSTETKLRYMPLAHPELLPEPGTMVVSYSRNTTETDTIQDDPSRYRPEFLRIDLP